MTRCRLGRELAAGFGLCLSAFACSSAVTDEHAAVGSVSSELRPLSAEEALADYDTMVEAFRANYGPLQRKEERYNFRFDDHAQALRKQLEQADSGVERERVFASFIARFEDLHVSLSAALPTDEAPGVSIPVRVMPIEDTYVVYSVGKEPGSATYPNVVRGDELLAIDGVPPAELVKHFTPLIGMPNPRTQAHYAALRLTSRTAIFAQGVADGDPVVLHVRSADASEHDVQLTWHALQSGLTAKPDVPAAGSGALPLGFSDAAAESIDAELAEYGAPVPFFMTKAVQTQFEIGKPIFPSESALADFGVSGQELLDIDYYAVKYIYQGKRILLVRIPDYTASDAVSGSARLNYLRALLSEQQDTSDALVFDDTHNPGGAIELAQTFATMFASTTLDGLAEELHVDRAMIAGLLQDAKDIRAERDPSEKDLALALDLEKQARHLDDLLSAGKTLSEPMQLATIPLQPEPDRIRWTKPLLVLVDELSVSCGDMFPLLIKANKLAPLFGQTTSGAGGNVESLARLPNSGVSLRLTRGTVAAFDPSGAYPEDRFIEDHGVAPDIEYSHTLADFRAGYVGYFDAFNKALLEHMDHNH